MGRSLHSILIALLASLVSLVPATGPATAYPTPVDFDGSLLRWDIGIANPAITYEIVATRAADRTVYAPAVDDSAQLWTDVPGSYFTFSPALPDQTAQVTVHLESTIDGGDYSAGYAIFDGYEGSKPTHCAIHVTIDDAVSYYSLAKTVLHELGHCAGLGHTLIPEAIMSYDLEKNSFALDVDDVAALTRLYPADGSQPRLPPGCAVGAMQTSVASTSMMFVWLLLPLLAAAGRRPKLGFEKRTI